jgi:non-reducing end alpha-L-arabinofuranosidase
VRVVLVLAVAIGLAAVAGQSQTAPSESASGSVPTTEQSRPADQVVARPCDILAAAGTPCVAAHAITRALFAGYTGPLYQVRRESDGAVADVDAAPQSGVADPAAQNALCAGAACVITRIYDQTPRHNDLTVEPAGTNGGADHPVRADALPVTVAGQPVFGASFEGKMGYRHRAADGVAVRGQPEGMYMVASGTHTNDNCCFDYGNAERSVADNGNGHMDAIFFGCYTSACPGGPVVAADLENGLFQSSRGLDPEAGGNPAPFVVAMLHTDGRRTFAIKDADAATGALTTRFAGRLPTNRPGYSPLRQEGSIVLGTGGDNSNLAIGSFFEGAMTAGTPTDAAEDAVAADVAAMHYGSR